MEDIRIYVASLSDYNDGRLEGKWLDFSDYSDASELMEAIQEMLDELTEKYKSVDGEVREEFADHDYEGIPSTMASEYMGEQDFQRIYDIAEIAEESNVPLEVLMERAGDTGSDDYKALAESLMFVVDGSNEGDIVMEWEDQIGELGFDFWQNHIYIDDVTERVIYGKDVDTFREEILSENPDMDEAEAEAEAERMADAQAENREDLPSYLEEMGYGDTIPDFVSKDYEGAWERSMRYDYDVIYHDGQMYVFSNNYSVGGTILSGMIGAYIGYKVGRAKPQKKGFSTEKRIGRNIKSSLSKKKYEHGGGVGMYDAHKANIKYLESISEMEKMKILKNIANHYGISVNEAEEEVTYDYAEYLYEYIANDSSLRMKVYQEMKANKMERGGKFNQSWSQDHYRHNKGESYEVPISKRKHKYADGGGVGKRKRLTKGKLMLNIYKPSGDFYMEKKDDGYIVHFTSRDAGQNISHLMDKFDVQDYGKGYHGSAYLIREKETMAKGGMTEHGLKVGDEIMGYTKDVNELHVVNRKNNDEWHSVDLDDGKRYEGGGGVSGLNDLIRG